MVTTYLKYEYHVHSQLINPQLMELAESLDGVTEMLFTFFAMSRRTRRASFKGLRLSWYHLLMFDWPAHPPRLCCSTDS
jgi:hypothetical protein